MILKEKAAQWNVDKEIQAIVAEINAEDGVMSRGGSVEHRYREALKSRVR